jgi:RecB family exonuclease
MQPLLLSYSAIETYKTCKRKYYYNYILKLPKKTWPWFTLGSFIHLILEKYHKLSKRFKKYNHNYDKKQLMLRCFNSALKLNQRSSERISKSQMAEAKEIIKNYFNFIENNDPDVFYIEQSFKIKLFDEVYLHGYIDRIDKLEENHYHIVDYKTSKTKSESKDSLQLSIYAIALKHILNKNIKIDKSLLFLRFKLKYDKAPQENDEKILKEVTEKAKEIKIARDTFKDSEWESTPNKYCFMCDFKTRCEMDKESKGYD